MQENKSFMLPCLQSVGPWWSEDDRKTLFFHLKKIFDLDDDYLSSLPASRGVNDNGEYHLNSVIIKNEYALFENRCSSKLSCPRLREHAFSFGKLNPKTCYLCPYSRTYKNKEISDEYRFINYLIKDGISLKEYVSDGSDVGKAFFSYFPAYVDGVLVEAYPFSLFVESAMKIGMFRECNETETNLFKDEILGLMREDIDKKIKYIRLKNLIEKANPNYQEQILSSADTMLKELLSENPSLRRADATLLRRLYFRLRDRKSYVAKKPSDYMNEAPMLLCSELFESLKGDGGSAAPAVRPQHEDIVKEDIPVLPEDSNVCFEEPVKNPDDHHRGSSVIEAMGILSSLDLSVPEGFNDLDKACIEAAGAFEQTGPDHPVNVPVSIITRQEEPLQQKVVPESSEEIRFSDFYIIDEQADLFSYGSAGDCADQTIFDSFISDSTYLCMEPVVFGGREGVLICNGQEYTFYCIADYGAKPLRKIADLKIAVYTSNIFMLCRYLFRQKVFELDIKDVGIARSLFTGKKIHGLSDISKESFPCCMKEYLHLYMKALYSLSGEQREYLFLLEGYFKIFCSDGYPAPFEKGAGMYVLEDSLSLSCIYEKGDIPLTDGAFLSICTGSADKTEISDIVINYMRTCIELNKNIPFAQGDIYILRCNASGLLLYVPGGNLLIQKIQLYLSSCARRVFSSDEKTSSVVLEEFISPYSRQKKGRD